MRYTDTNTSRYGTDWNTSQDELIESIDLLAEDIGGTWYQASGLIVSLQAPRHNVWANGEHVIKFIVGKDATDSMTVFRAGFHPCAIACRKYVA
jgi:hypothetical protein